MRGAIFFCFTLLFSAQAYAVPVPWLNCGHPGDGVAVQELVANVWPPGNRGPTGPIFASAKLDPQWGDIKRLRVVLFPFNWVFELKDIPTDVHDGFVPLPGSWLVNGSPPMPLDTEDFQGLPKLGPVLHGYLDQLPVPAGPFNNEVTLPFGDPDARPFTLLVRAAIFTPIPFMKASFSMSYNGVSGFPLHPAVGGVYDAHLRVTEPSGAEVLCMNVAEPIKFADTLGARVERVPFGRFWTERGKGVVTLAWAYGKPGETIPSASMKPQVEIRSCSKVRLSGEDERLRPSYDLFSGIWSVSLPAIDLDDCDIFIRSGLTGQTDGPFPVDPVSFKLRSG